VDTGASSGKPNADCAKLNQGNHTRSSATAEKQRVSCACLPRLAN